MRGCLLNLMLAQLAAALTHLSSGHLVVETTDYDSVEYGAQIMTRRGVWHRRHFD